MSTTNGNGHHRPQITVKPSGHPVVDAIYKLEADAKKDEVQLFGKGHFVPDLWYHAIVGEDGRANFIAASCMGELWFRHRPEQHVHLKDNGDKVVTLVKAFEADEYQWNRGDMAKRLNVCSRSISRALSLLVKLGFVSRREEDRTINGRKYRKCVFVKLHLESFLNAIDKCRKKLSTKSSNDQNDHKNEGTYSPDVGTNGLHGRDYKSPREDNGSPRGDSNGTVSRSLLQKSSSSSFSAKPKTKSENITTNTSSASASPSATGSGADDAEESLVASLPKEEQKRAETMLGHLKVRYSEFYKGDKLSIPEGFASKLTELKVKEDLTWLGILHDISFSWILVETTDEVDGFDPAWHSNECVHQLKRLFKVNQKESSSFLEMISSEVYKADLGDFDDQESEQALWDKWLARLKKKISQKEMQTVGGKKLYDPSDSSWFGLSKVLKEWKDFGDEYKPAPEWFKVVTARIENPGPESQGAHKCYFEEVCAKFEKLGLTQKAAV